ncbi:hypothetical protein FEF65_07300 [Mariprofundus erugo]|uniref:SPOR domain-containing protein n=1 Tax=Mariprofundus erugo TaxID=2528639 RepID=A0A5R9GNL2_9PROT|nr:SPOR domain-containing protein [Mariprofundus erugo]TLS67238.1 hypothetical protein FEF65_07300 [Mariprofundus erugo]
MPALWLALWLVATPAFAGITHQQAYQMLKTGDAPMVATLPKGEREILMATLAMEEGHSSEVIDILSSPNVGKDPVAARLRAEAYRRQSVSAAMRAGRYAHAMSEDIGKLKQAGIGLDAANQRLQAFLDRVDQQGEAERQAAEKQAAERQAAERQAAERQAAERQAAERQAAEKQAAEKQAAEKQAAEKQAAEKQAAEKQAAEKQAAERQAAERQAAERQAAERQAAEKQAAEKQAAEKQAAERQAAERQAAERQAAERQAAERQAAERQAAERQADAQLLDSVTQAVTEWRRDWESRNTDAYLLHYHKAFRSGKYNYASWAAYKRQVNAGKSFIHIDISRITLISSLVKIDQGEAVLVEFRQQYKSNNYTANSRKRLYLVRKSADQPWLILAEGNGELRPREAVARSMAGQPSASSTAWVINLASYDSRSAAEKMAEALTLPDEIQASVYTTVAKGKQVHRVRAGSYASRAEANDAMASICPDLGFRDCWLEQAESN